MYLDQRQGVAFEKNRHGVYVWCSELFAEFSGMDSPHNVIGKNDEELVWQKGGHRCDLSDKQVQQVNTLSTNEVVKTTAGWTDLAVAKHCHDKETIMGNLLPTKGIRSQTIETLGPNGMHIPQINQWLSIQELRVLADLLTFVSPEETARRMNKSRETIYNWRKSLCKAFSAKNKTELVLTLNRYCLSCSILTMLEYGLLD